MGSVHLGYRQGVANTDSTQPAEAAKQEPSTGLSALNDRGRR